MTKTATGPQAVVFAGKESSNSDQVSGSIGSTASMDKVSVEMWINMKDNGSTQNAFGSMLFSWLGSPHYNVYHYKNAIGFNTINSEIYGVNATALVGEWSHIVFVMVKGGATTDQKIYINGVRQTEVCNPPVTSLTSSCNWPSGRAFNSSGDFLLMNNGYSANTWNAKADVGMVRIYNSELTQSEVTAAFDATKVNGYIDTTAPSVVSVTTPTSPSTSRNLSYSYTFSESITGLVSNSFEVSGTATGCVVAPASSSGITVQVEVTCSTDGTVILQLKQNSIADLARLTGPSTAHSASSVTIAVPVVTTTSAPVVTTTIAPVTTTAAPVVTTTVTPVTTTVVAATPVATPTQVTEAPVPQTAIAAPPVTTKSAPRAAVTTTTVSTVTTSVVPATTTTTSTIPVMSTIDIPNLETTSAVLEVNGKPVVVNIARQNNQLQITSRTFSAVMQIVKRDGSVSSLNSGGAMSGEGGDSLNVEFDGLQTGSMLEARMYSDPVVLGRTKVPAEGKVTASYVIPEDMNTGGHSLAVLGIDTAGAPISFFAPIEVESDETGPGVVAFLIAIPVLSAIAVGLFLPPALRRRKVA
jgi:hypothetical protein